MKWQEMDTEDKGMFTFLMVVLTAGFLVILYSLTIGIGHNTNARDRESACHAAGGAMVSPGSGTDLGCYKITVQHEPIAVEPYR